MTPADTTGPHPPRSSERGPGESVVILVSLCRFAEAIAVGMLVPILPLFIASFEISDTGGISGWIRDQLPAFASRIPSLVSPTAESRTALVFSIAGITMSIAQIFSGRLSDRFDRRKPFIIAGMLGGAACSAALALADSFSDLLVTRIAQTTFLGLTFPPMMAIIARHSSPGRGGRMLGLYSTIRLLGFALGPPVGGLLAQFGGIQTTFYGSAILLTVSIALVARFVPDPREGPVKRSERGPRVPVPFMFRLLGASTFLMMVGIAAVISLFPAYQREFGATEAQLGLAFSAFIGTRCLFQYASGWLGDRFDKKLVLLGALALLGPLVALQAYATSLNQLIVLRMGLGVASAAMSASIGGISAERSQAGNRARVMGINSMSFTMGVATGPLLTGFIPDRKLAFAIPGVAALLWIAVIAFVVPGDRTHARYEEEKLGKSASTPPASSAKSTSPA